MKTLALSARADLLRPSPTLGITAKAATMRQAGLDVLSFAAGEPDFATPELICDAAAAALREGFTKYTPSSGIPALREAISAKLERENGLDVPASDVVVSCGAKHSVYNALQVLVNPGDEVLLLAPYWMTYADQIRLAGGVPVAVPTLAGKAFAPDVDRVLDAFTPRTRAIILNSPCNPTGAVFERETLRAIAHGAASNGAWIISDEIYERLTYGAVHQSVAALGGEIAERTVTIGGCSKSYAMTGWRIGFAAAPRPVAQAMSNLQDQVTSNATSFAQKGAVVAFNLPAEAVEAMRVEFEARRDLIVAGLLAIEGVTLDAPKGAFYVLPDVSRWMDGDDARLADHLLEHARVAVVPGSVFEGPGHLRLSYATSRENIERGVARIREALLRLPQAR